MKLIEINWAPTNRQLRQFGAICFIVLPLIGWLWGAEVNVTIVLGVTGLLMTIVGLVTPSVLKPIFIGMQIIATPFEIVLSEAAMLLIFFGVFLPIGLVFRIARKDAMKKSLNPSDDSYWAAKQQPADVARYYRQS